MLTMAYFKMCSEKGTVVLKSVMLTDLAFLSTSGLSEFSRVHGAQLLISFKNFNMGAILFSRHPRSRTEIGSGKKRQEIRLENLSTYNYLNLNKTG